MKLRISTIIAILMGISLCNGQSVITTVAGTGKCCADVDGVDAMLAYLQGPDGLAIDAVGNLYIWENQIFRVRKVTPAGIITTVAGVSETPGSSGDGGLATKALLMGASTHAGLAIDGAGNLYISDTNNHKIRKVDTNGIITTFAGTGTQGFSGDNGLAIDATLFYPEGIAVDKDGTVYIADTSNGRIRKVSTAGIITTVAGGGTVAVAGDGVAATSAAIGGAEGIAVDSARNLYVSAGRRIFKVNGATAILTLLAGDGTAGSGGDGGPAVKAQLKDAIGMVADSAGNLYFADVSNQRIRKVDAAGIMTTLAGSTLGFSGDGGPAASALLAVPHDVVLDSSGNVVFTDTGNHRIRKIAASGPTISITPTPLTFSYTIGGANPAAQSVAVASSGAALSFTASASSTGNWLSVSPTGGTTPATLSVSISPAGLPGGSYQGAVTVTPSGGASPQSFTVTLTINGAGAPTFPAGSIVNATGYQTKLAPDTVFVIFGSNMGPAAIATATAPNYPLSLGGTSITFTPTAGGSAIGAKMVYSFGGQVAGLLPSSIAPGTYAVRVTYNSLTSAPQNVTVVARSFGIATANGYGSSAAQATIANVNSGLSLIRYTTGGVDFGGYHWILSPVHPDDTLILWGTGGGADAANDTGGSSGDQTAAGNFFVTVGTRKLTPSYAGTSQGYPGLWQINLHLPTDIELDCFAPIQVSAGGEVGNIASIAIAAPGQSACSNPQYQSLLSKMDAGGNIVFGAFAIARLGSSANGTFQESGSGFFGRYTPTEFALPNIGPKFGSCTVYDRTYPVNTKDPAGPDAFLDAGTKLPMSGPNLAAGTALGVNPFVASGINYFLVPANGTFVGGNYTLSGTGGKDVGAFNTTVTFPTDFQVTNYDTINSIDRTKPLTFNWTGTGVDQVYILVNSSSVGGGIQHIVSLNCYVPGTPGTYTIPPAALAYLLPSPATGSSGFGSISIEAMNSGLFTAPLTAGGKVDFGNLSGDLGYGKNVAIQ